MQKVEVRGIVCEFYDMRIDRTTIPEGKFLYEVADDDDDGCGDPARIKVCILVNFFGTLICDRELALEDEGVLWVMAGDWRWL
ncbi:MAG: hypothetical protein QM657_07300 [Lacrimispora sp.]|uniref:LPD28 domain-containing protein n=1 Tax=Lacrimispora sp. TaxID=2719234 RepID=UPI0039E29908